MPFQIHPVKIVGAYQVIGKPMEDERGVFSRLFCPRELDVVWQDRSICQINYSLTCSIGAIRGLHFQKPPQSETKLVKCLQGRVWDAVVDLRPHSPTFLQWQAIELTPDKHNALLIPEGCAHGFQVMEPNSELLYLHSEFYYPDQEDGLRWDDPVLNINWPLPVSDLSARDQNHKLIENINTDARLQSMVDIILRTTDC